MHVPAALSASEATPNLTKTTDYRLNTSMVIGTAIGL
jgi:hypothetical protein